ncbi:nucleoside ABC transporter membrane protein [Seinonella peptonophila]|uniref:Nucleoside ABC transporter membrane protein n=1 Tax=Seinonella peptonophila TaxID=112248 RepID=A0A1M5A5S7_9BACL|nr:ABC transporter permease [Seinonella peptonophila]SHF25679.1 nucleoside ABC transporter membrane protein [Seinonella peptonophila]
MIQAIWEQVLNLTLFVVLLRVTVPILLSALGGMISMVGGVVNIGLEGIMLLSAFSSIAVGAATGSWLLGVVAGVIISILVSMLMGFFSIKLKVDIIIVGFAVNILGSGLTIFLMNKIYGLTGNYSPEQLNRIPSIHIPFIEQIPIIGKLLSGHNLMVWVSIIAVFLCLVLLYRTPHGIHLRAVGESPEAAASLGISVDRMQFIALAWSGLFAGLAGAYLSMGMTSMFVKDMTAGTGFIALAVVMLGGSNPVGILIGSLIFGLGSTITTIVQTIPGNQIPSQFVQMIPYVVTILALIILAIRKKKKQLELTSQSTTQS